MLSVSPVCFYMVCRHVCDMHWKKGKQPGFCRMGHINGLSIDIGLSRKLHFMTYECRNQFGLNFERTKWSSVMTRDKHEWLPVL